MKAIISRDGNIQYGEYSGSIHKVGREILKAPCNGWMTWYYIDQETGRREPIDKLRQKIRNEMALDNSNGTKIGKGS